MAQSEQIGFIELLRNAIKHGRKYALFLLVFTIIGWCLTWFLSADFEEKYAARGVFIANDNDLKADFIYFRTLGDRFNETENSEISAIFANELILDDGTRAIDITLHLNSPNTGVVDEIRQDAISRSLQEIVPFTISNKPVLVKYNIWLSGAIIALLIGVFISIFHKAWIDSAPIVLK